MIPLVKMVSWMKTLKQTKQKSIQQNNWDMEEPAVLDEEKVNKLI